MTDRSMGALLRNLTKRIISLERRLARGTAPGPSPSVLAMTGEVKLWTVDTAPSGWLICDGSAVSRVDFAELFDLIGTTYGVGDGATTFNVPDMRGRVPVARNPADSDFDTLGEAGGAKTHTHGMAHTHTMAHTHGLAAGFARIVQDSAAIFSARVSVAAFTGNWRNVVSGAAFTQTGLGAATSLGGSTDASSAASTGGSSAANTASDSSLQPYLVLSYIIKA